MYTYNTYTPCCNKFGDIVDVSVIFHVPVPYVYCVYGIV